LKEFEQQKEEHEAALEAALEAGEAARQKAELEKAELAARNIDISLPKEFIGSIIGKKGVNVQEIMKQTGTNITVRSEIGKIY
jgi:polyribonucleotide nucleotidyltransferase